VHRQERILSRYAIGIDLARGDHHVIETPSGLPATAGGSA
jgi:hypothetical protein